MKTSLPSKRNLTRSAIAIAVTCAAIWGTRSTAQGQLNSAVQNWAMGPASAQVTLLEYGSLTCGHCARFHNEVMPEIKRRYVTTGRVRYVFRPLPTPPFDLAVGMHALTLCAGPSRYYPLVEAFFERQQDVFSAAGGETGPKGTLLAIAEDFGGLSYQASEACLRDPTRQTQVRASAEAGVAAGVTGTPTLFINGVRVPVRAGQTHYEVSDVSQANETALRLRMTTPAKAKRR